MENTVEIIIKPKHFRNATRFIDNNKCPLALAIKDHFKNDLLCVTSFRVYENNKPVYLMYWGYCGMAHGSLGYHKDGKQLHVDDVIKRAKQKKKVGSFSIILTKIY